MSTTAKATTTVPTNKPAQIYAEQSTDDVTTPVTDARNKPLMIILAVTLPTLAVIGMFILFVVCYRRRHATIWLKKIGQSSRSAVVSPFAVAFVNVEHSSRLQAIVVNLSSSPLQAQ
jgi:ribose/xylose/arabinose/galactoside ABC-type transport system permease subunit